MRSTHRYPSGRSVSADRTGRALARQFKEANFEPVQLKPGYYYQSITEWQSVALALLDAAWGPLSRIKDQRLRAQELEHLQKMMVCWRNIGFGRQLDWPTKLRKVSSPAQAAAVRPYLRMKGRLYASIIRANPALFRAIFWNAQVVVNKGKGAGLFIRGTVEGAAQAYASIVYHLKDIHRVIDYCNNIRPERVPLMLTRYRRIQAARKKVTGYRPDSRGWLTQAYEFDGPKVRDIKATPFVLNIYAFGVVGVWKWLQRATSERHDGRIDQAERLDAELGTGIAIDFSSYDDTIALETLDTVRAEVEVPMCDALLDIGIPGWLLDGFLVTDEWNAVADLLSPPRNGTEGACVVPTAGGIKSGENPTSVKGTEVADAFGEHLRTLYRPRRYAHLNQGDDQLFFGDITAEQIIKATEPLGLVAAEAPDTTYLMRHIPGAYMYVGRALSSTINDEPNLEPKSWTQAWSSVAIRHSLLEGNPAQATYMDALMAHPNTRAVAEYAKNIDVLTAQRVLATLQLAPQTDRTAEEYLESLGLQPGEVEKLAPVVEKNLKRTSTTVERLFEDAQQIKLETATSFLRKASE